MGARTRRGDCPAKLSNELIRVPAAIFTTKKGIYVELAPVLHYEHTSERAIMINRSAFVTLVTAIVLTGCSSPTPSNEAPAKSTESPVTPTASEKAPVDTVSISKKVDDKETLFIVLGKDGAVTRKGTGKDDKAEETAFVGVTKEPLFQQVMDTVPKMFVEAPKVPLRSSGKLLGKKCEIVLTFKRGAQENGFNLVYGSIKGPPKDLTKVVAKAVEVTEPWYQQEKKAAAQKAPKK